MAIKVWTVDARDRLSEIIAAYLGGETFLGEKEGKPCALGLGADRYRELPSSSADEAPSVEKSG